MIEENICELWQSNTKRVIPLQEEFCNYYLAIHEEKIENYSDKVKQGIKGRLLRSYPSLVRESHFGALIGKLLSQKDASYTVLSETDIDMEKGVDLVLVVNGHPFSIKITKESNGTDWAKIKKERKSEVDNPHPIKVVVNSSNTYSIGQSENPMWLFKESTASELIENCLSLDAQDST